jgi:ATP synthase protein I
MSDKTPPEPDPAQERRSLDSLRRDVGDAIDKRHAQENPEGRAEKSGDAKSMGVALRMSAEFASAIVVGAFLGFGFDTAFKTSPWGLLICLPLGFAAGVLNVVRAARQMSAEAPKGQDSPPEPDED